MLEFQLTEQLSYKGEIVVLEKGKSIPLKATDPAIVFVKEAPVSLSYSSIEKKLISTGQFFLLPRDFVCLAESETDQQVLLLRIPNMTAIYIHFMPPLAKEEVGDFEHLLYPLPMTDAIFTLVDSVLFYINEKHTSSQLMGLKAFELFYFLKTFYSEDLIKHFFTPILKKEYTFALFILTHYSKVKNADELAHLSNYTFSGFDKQFRKVFGMAPYKWMLQKKVSRIYLEICTTSKPIKVIAEEFGFTNSSHLGDFCRKHIGMSPVRLRKKQIG
ncbi:MAG: AraC family transcriptional regulator [Tannerellaceae bacterium]|nr:AraC family transcriptional regulator [Tannerellaceae bacterium]